MFGYYQTQSLLDQKWAFSNLIELSGWVNDFFENNPAFLTH